MARTPQIVTTVAGGVTRRSALATLLAASSIPAQPSSSPGFAPGKRVLLDAHNCYPYDGQWFDRIERALKTGYPLAIEQDLYWYTDPVSKASRSLVSHGDPATGHEPTLRSYFLERIRPYMEAALRLANSAVWPLITLNLDFKSDEPEHLRAIWKLTGEYEPWLTTAEKNGQDNAVAPLRPGPLLILTGESDAHQFVFHDQISAGERLRIFGAAHAGDKNPGASPEQLVPDRATNYRRWWNNPWKVVEAGGQPKAGAWTSRKMERLRALVRQAHGRGLWIRFYTLNGHPPSQSAGWDEGYNFGSKEQVLARWKAAVDAGVDFVATDQYEDFAAEALVVRPTPFR